MPDKGDQELPPTLEQNPDRARVRAQAEDPYQTMASQARKFGYEDLANQLLSQGEEKEKEAAERFDSVDREVLKQANLIGDVANRMTKGERAGYLFLLRGRTKESEEVLNKLHMLLNAIEDPEKRVTDSIITGDTIYKYDRVGLFTKVYITNLGYELVEERREDRQATESYGLRSGKPIAENNYGWFEGFPNSKEPLIAISLRKPTP